MGNNRLTRRSVKSAIYQLALTLVLVALPNAVAFAEPLSTEQGELILQELKEIKILLQRTLESRTPVNPTPKPWREQANRIEVSIIDGIVIGQDDAPLTLVEFSDYQCPFCQRFFANTMPHLKTQYVDTGQLRLVVRDLPLAFHRQAKPAAIASRCAHAQNAFLPMREKLFIETQRQVEADFLAIAIELGLKPRRFSECMASNVITEIVESSVRDAQARGITGTPTFVLGATEEDYVEGIIIVGAQPFSSFKAQIDLMLSQLSEPGT
jgi:protein-disulfide isomerase